MIPLEEARAFVLAACRRLPSEVLPLERAEGCVTSAAVLSPEDVPAFANSAMDGFAVRASDTTGAGSAPVRLRVVGTIAAGSATDRALGRGEAMRIMTGAAMPPGADAVVMVENTTAEDGYVVVHRPARGGDHVRAAGDDIRAGQVLVPAGTEVRAAQVGLLAGAGAQRVEVVRRARVGVLSTGDELCAGPGPLAPGQIRDTNRPALLALVRESGWEAVDLGTAADKEAEIGAALERAAGTCDAVLTSGGVSVGDFDWTKKVLDRLSGGTMRWMQVAIKPAKPFAFGTIGATPVFGLPGNPVSAMVSFEMFARPGIRQMTGHEDLYRPEVVALAAEALPRRQDGKLHLMRAVAWPEPDGRYRVRLAGGQGSHQLSAMAAANALALVPDGEGVPVGAPVRTMLLG